MYWTQISLTILLMGFFPAQSYSPGGARSEGWIVLPIQTEQLKPHNGPSQDIPLIQVADLLANPDFYHGQVIIVRGIVRRLELHLDESTLFIDYVFWLKDGEHQVLVFGQHDRTTGDIQMVTDRVVEVRGLFWKERFVNGYRLTNNLEAQQVRFFPTVNADRA